MLQSCKSYGFIDFGSAFNHIRQVSIAIVGNISYYGFCTIFLQFQPRRCIRFAHLVFVFRKMQTYLYYLSLEWLLLRYCYFYIFRNLHMVKRALYLSMGFFFFELIQNLKRCKLFKYLHIIEDKWVCNSNFPEISVFKMFEIEKMSDTWIMKEPIRCIIT